MKRKKKMWPCLSSYWISRAGIAEYAWHWGWHVRETGGLPHFRVQFQHPELYVEGNCAYQKRLLSWDKWEKIAFKTQLIFLGIEMVLLCKDTLARWVTLGKVLYLSEPVFLSAKQACFLICCSDSTSPRGLKGTVYVEPSPQCQAEPTLPKEVVPV